MGDISICRYKNKRYLSKRFQKSNQLHVITFQALVQRGAEKISAYVTHAIFPKESWKHFIGCTPEFENFWMTDSVPHAVEICKNPPFKMISLCDSISESLLGYDLMPQWLLCMTDLYCTMDIKHFIIIVW